LFLRSSRFWRSASLTWAQRDTAGRPHQRRISWKGRVEGDARVSRRLIKAKAKKKKKKKEKKKREKKKKGGGYARFDLLAIFSRRVCAVCKN